MNKKILKLISTVDDDYNKIITKQLVDVGALDQNNWWYLHGKLEDIFHYDKATVYNLNSFPKYRKKTVNWKFISGNTTNVENIEYHYEMHCNDIIPVEVRGVEEKCIGYFWTTEERDVKAITSTGQEEIFSYWKQRGLVCLESDVEANKIAREKYNKKLEHL